MTKFVAGFLTDGERVLLVRKSHPPALAGRLNAIGGKVEPGETYAQAMQREFAEETTIGNPLSWREYCQLDGNYPLNGNGAEIFTVVFFICTVLPGFMDSVEFLNGSPNDVDELMFVVEVKRVPWLACLPNVPWLLAMGLSMAAGERAAGFTVTERY